MLRFQYKQIEQEVYMPVSELNGTYVKEFALGKLHGLRQSETLLGESIVKLQQQIQDSKQDEK